MMLYFFGTATISPQDSPRIDKDLKAYLLPSLPDPLSINKYMVSLSKKSGIPLEQINQVGHNFNEDMALFQNQPQGG